MSGRFKGDLINGAYSRLRISGLTVNANPEEIQLSLKRLEMMANEFYQRNICLDYNFEENPDPNSDHGIDAGYWDAVECVLAKRLMLDFGKGQAPDPMLITDAKAGMSLLYSGTAKVKQTQYPSRMPIGSGTTLRYPKWQRFYSPKSEAPISCETKILYIDEIQDYSETWANYIRDIETIDSYTIGVNTGIELISSSLSTPVISYSIKATGRNDNLPNDLLQMKITVTTSTGRVDTRIINFKFNEIPSELTQVAP